jgi:1,4-alpha-glucan branching enzyme
MSLKKQYFKTKSVGKVTFEYANENAKKINLIGDFNNWDKNGIPMKKKKSGEFSIAVELEKGKEYQFKYLIDGNEWDNDMEADKFVMNEFQGENSVVIV